MFDNTIVIIKISDIPRTVAENLPCELKSKP